MRKWARTAVLGGILGLSACSGLSPRPEGVFKETESPGSMSRLEVRMRGVELARQIPVAVGVTATEVRGVPLEGGSTWRFEHAVSARPEVTGGVVVGLGGGELFALRATTGGLLWTRPAGGMELLGAGDDGEMTVVALGSAVGTTSYLLSVARSGAVYRQIEIDKRMGRPAVVRGVAFVPWSERYVSAFDVLLGQEVGRLSLRRGVWSASIEHGGLVFGAQSLVRFDAGLSRWSPDELPRAEVPASELVSAPRLVPRLAEARALFAGEPDRVRVYAQPTAPGKEMSLEDGRYYVAFHRAVMARRTDGEFPVWVRLRARPTIGGAAYEGGLAVCDESGQVTLLSESSGNEEGTLSLGGDVLSCVVQGGDLHRTDSGVTGSLPEQLGEMVQATDRDLVPLQREALAMLGRLGDDATTEKLVALSTDPQTPPGCLPEVRAMLGRRRRGAEALLQGLARLPSPRRPGVLPTPVAELAQALVALGETRAAPLLLDHMEHPYSEPATVLVAARALGTLASAKDAPRLAAFVALYRAAAGEPALQEAVVAAAAALRRVGGEDGERRVREAASDPLTEEGVRAGLTALLREPSRDAR